MSQNLPRVLVIGAGPSALSFLRSVNVVQQKLNKKVAELSCFEIQQDWSGQWNLQWRTGVDKYGQPVPNSMYKGLWTNTPKEVFQFPDYTFFEHFGCNIPSYLPRQVFKSYFMQRYRKADIRKFIQFQTAVRQVEFIKQQNKFRAVMHDLKNDKQIYGEYDYIVVGSGHYSVPFAPYYKGFQKFNGRIMHSHDLRQWNCFKDRRVLVVGGSLSAEDVALQCYKYGSSHVTLSYHIAPVKYKWPEKMDCRPCLTEAERNKVKFSDGSEAEYDVIILCTGYQHHYPFLADQLRLKTRSRFYPYLYMGTVFHNNPRIFYIGAQNQVFSLTMFELQAYYVRDLILGTAKLPSALQMKEDTQARQKEEQNIRSFKALFDFKEKYMRDLMEKSDYPRWDISKSTNIINQMIGHKRKEILSYRDNVFKSVITGVVSARYPKRWVDQLDDSYESFMSHFITPKM